MTYGSRPSETVQLLFRKCSVENKATIWRPCETLPLGLMAVGYESLELGMWNSVRRVTKCFVLNAPILIVTNMATVRNSEILNNEYNLAGICTSKIHVQKCITNVYRYSAYRIDIRFERK